MKLPSFSAYLPSKKFVLLILAGLLITGTGFLIFAPTKKSENIKQETSLNQPVIVEEIAKDSDADGLQDWEEALWKTDPNNPDTDGDGVFDGQEIKENRNPLLAGDGKTDKIENLNPEKSPAEQAIQLPTTLTEALGQEFFSEYLRLKQASNGELSEIEKAELVNSLISGLNNFEKKTNDYLESDIKIAPTDDEKTIKEYGNNLALIIKKYFDPLPEIEMAIFAKALSAAEENKKTELNKLGPITNAYRNAAKEMVSLPTPASFAESHLKLANYFNNIANEINELQKFFKDPMQAMLAFKQYQTNAEEAYLILLGLNAYFSEKKVVFESNEPAEFFKIYVAAAIAQTNK